ncbi:protein SUPPRESSOR OF PHYTOCHROME B 5-like [Zingiber officinale]|uniref:Uncharacterized protein n=1 Tax=Zingiber officinale TaxID=94328 RepID=A0A8J5IML6_ZINOF|nr:protein SUPPRESSOR OF PHYTOCHROME B 5-like [Zingiber officinale]KAG6537950.1 hypothetical protein ZIOFF_003053 [Zingiber officinale]
MSTSKLSGYSEECSSCESGWTEYLVSDDNGEAEFVLVDSGDEDRNGGSDKDTDDDDDSMASDASTGLVNSKQKLGNDGEESPQCSSQSDKFYQLEVSNRRKCEPQTELNSTSLYGKSKDRKKRL